MLTQAMPQFAQALQGAMPDATVRSLMQALGNCNQPLEHRGPVSITPAPAINEQGGVYSANNIFNDSRSWNTTNLLGDSFSTQYMDFVYNNISDQYFNASQFFSDTFFNNNIDARTFSEIFQTNDIYNNNSFVDNSSVTNNFAGDSFLFNNNSQFITNNFPTTVVIGQPGAPGPPGTDGRDGTQGRNGVDGQAGAAGAPGQPGIGVPGRDGVAGTNGRDGSQGRDGAAGPPGLDGITRVIIEGGGGGYDLVEGPPRLSDPFPPPILDIKAVNVDVPVPLYEINVADALSQDGTEDIKVKVQVPKYSFDPDSCSLTSDGTDEVEITVPVPLYSLNPAAFTLAENGNKNVAIQVKADVTAKSPPGRLTLPGKVSLRAKPSYP